MTFVRWQRLVTPSAHRTFVERGAQVLRISANCSLLPPHSTFTVSISHPRPPTFTPTSQPTLTPSPMLALHPIPASALSTRDQDENGPKRGRHYAVMREKTRVPAGAPPRGVAGFPAVTDCQIPFITVVDLPPSAQLFLLSLPRSFPSTCDIFIYTAKELSITLPPVCIYSTTT